VTAHDAHWSCHVLSSKHLERRAMARTPSTPGCRRSRGTSPGPRSPWRHITMRRGRGAPPRRGAQLLTPLVKIESRVLPPGTKPPWVCEPVESPPPGVVRPWGDGLPSTAALFVRRPCPPTGAWAGGAALGVEEHRDANRPGLLQQPETDDGVHPGDARGRARMSAFPPLHPEELRTAMMPL